MTIKEMHGLISQNLRLIQYSTGKTNEEMGKIIGTSGTTWWRKKNEPETLTISECLLICQVANVPLDSFLTKNLMIGG